MCLCVILTFIFHSLQCIYGEIHCYQEKNRLNSCTHTHTLCHVYNISSLEMKYTVVWDIQK